MKILINKNISGLNNSFNFNIDNKSNLLIDLEELLILENRKIKRFDYEYNDLVSNLNLSEDIKWNKILNSKIIEDRKSEIKEVLKLLQSQNEYLEIYSSRIELVKKLQKNIIDNKVIDVPEYILNGTVTGRMTIKKGLNYLTMDKKTKSKFQSRWKTGKIVEIDLKSLEPFLYFKLKKNKEFKDVYTELNQILFDGKVDRSKCKIAIISCLYGAAINKISKLSGLTNKQSRELREYLEFEDFQKDLKNEFEENGYFKNYYGRKIFKSNAPVNHYIQSTASDFSFYVYNKLLKEYDLNYFRPVAIIHDAIIIDCHEKYLEEITNRSFIDEDIINCKAQISVNILNEEKIKRA